MADLSKLKRRNTLGSPPSVEEASQNLDSPEIVSANPVISPGVAEAKKAALEVPRIDGRTLRKTDRTIPFGTKVSPEFDIKLRQIAQRDGLKICEVLEKALEAYENR